jgi:hypothetical protein
VQVGAQVALALKGRLIRPEANDQGFTVEPAAVAAIVRGQAQQQRTGQRGRH